MSSCKHSKVFRDYDGNWHCFECWEMLEQDPAEEVPKPAILFAGLKANGIEYIHNEHQWQVNGYRFKYADFDKALECRLQMERGTE